MPRIKIQSSKPTALFMYKITNHRYDKQQQTTTNELEARDLGQVYKVFCGQPIPILRKICNYTTYERNSNVRSNELTTLIKSMQSRNK